MENQKFSIRALAIASSITWGLCVLFVGILNMIYPDYGVEFLGFVSSVYPGYEAAPNIRSVIIGTLYALVDGAIGGVLFALIYNLVLDCPLCKK